jgi:hypothetical protein
VRARCPRVHSCLPVFVHLLIPCQVLYRGHDRPHCRNLRHRPNRSVYRLFLRLCHAVRHVSLPHAVLAWETNVPDLSPPPSHAGIAEYCKGRNSSSRHEGERFVVNTECGNAGSGSCPSIRTTKNPNGPLFDISEIGHRQV